MLAVVLNHAAREKLIEKAPHVWRPPKPPPRDIVITQNDVKRLIEAAVSPHIALFIAIAFATGARSGAILALTWDRVDFVKNQISFSQSLPQERRKGRAVVPMGPSLRASLIQAREGALTGSVIEYAGQPVASIKKAFARVAKRANMPEVTPHVLRHSAACAMAEAGVTMSEIAQVLGHRDARTTERVYARYSPDYLRNAVRSIDVGVTSSNEPESVNQKRTNATQGGKFKTKKREKPTNAP